MTRGHSSGSGHQARQIGHPVHGTLQAFQQALAVQAQVQFFRIDHHTVEKGINRRDINDQEILERCLYPMVNEGAKILDEGMAQRASDIDIVWINGYGWPVYRGGPMFWAENDAGREKIATALERMGMDVSPRLKAGW